MNDTREVTGLVTLQFGARGLVDSKPIDGYAVHLVRSVKSGGTPGPTLCGVERFRKGAPGWSLGGGVTGSNIKHVPCDQCAKVARDLYPGLAPKDGIGAKEMRLVLEALA